MRPASKTARACGLAAGLIVLLNGLTGLALPRILSWGSVDELRELEERVARAPARAKVRVLAIGNSHAIAGLRPALLASALGLPDGTVFNLALPGASPLEMRLLLQRHLRDFPGVTRVVGTVDPFFLAGDPALRLRYLTHGRLQERWQLAQRAPFWDDRLGLLASAFLPLMDFGTALREKLAKSPLATPEQWADAFAAESDSKRSLGAVDYPYGFPPPWDRADVDAPVTMPRQPTREAMARQRAQVYIKVLPKAPAGLGDLQAIAHDLSARNIALTLAEPPFEDPLARALQSVGGSRYTRMRAAIHAGLPIVAAPLDWPPYCFYDPDHLSPLGSARFTRHLAAASRSALKGQGFRNP